MRRKAPNPLIRVTSRRRFKWRGWQSEILIDLNIGRVIWWAAFWLTLWHF
jgi:hypothetical protein